MAVSYFLQDEQFSVYIQMVTSQIKWILEKNVEEYVKALWWECFKQDRKSRNRNKTDRFDNMQVRMSVWQLYPNKIDKK